MATTIRPARQSDIPTITDIYNEAGVGTTASYDLEPVTVAEREAWLRDRQNHDWPVLVAESNGRVIGYASYGRFRDKAGYDRTVEHSVYVDGSARASGVGLMLMRALIDRARGNGVHVMVGALDGDNATSIAFHQKLGFVEVARMPEVGRKFGRWLDLVFVQMVFPETRVDD